MSMLICGRRIDDMTHAEIIEAAQAVAHEPYVGGAKFDFYRNRELLRAFGDERLLDGTTVMAGTAHSGPAGFSWSDNFRAVRTGEMLRWAAGVGIVDRAGDKWRLLMTEPVFELVGPEGQQVAMQVRGLPPADQVIASIIWQRELNRRERLRVRRVGKIMPSIVAHLDEIIRADPAAPTPEKIAHLAFGCTTLAEARNLILDGLVRGQPDDARRAHVVLEWTGMAARADYKKREREARVADDAMDLEAMADF